MGIVDSNYATIVSDFGRTRLLAKNLVDDSRVLGNITCAVRCLSSYSLKQFIYFRVLQRHFAMLRQTHRRNFVYFLELHDERDADEDLQVSPDYWQLLVIHSAHN